MAFEDKIKALEDAKFRPMRTIPFVSVEKEFNNLLDKAIKIIQNY